MQLKLNKCIGLAVLCVLFSCTTYRFLDIEVLKPAELPNINKINKLYIVNSERIALSQDLLKDSAFFRFFLMNFGIELQHKLRESPLFDSTKIINIKFSDFKDTFKNLPFEQRKYTTASYIQSFFYSDSVYSAYDYNASSWCTRYRVLYDIIFHFDNLAYTNNLSKNILVSDTLIWDSPIHTDAWIVNYLKLAKKEKYHEICKYIAEAYAYKLAPHWIKVERLLYYSPNKIMLKAYNLYEKDEIAGAIKQWQIVYNNGTKYLASMAAHNIAVSYEVLDSITLANEWVNKSVNLKPRPDSKFYQNILAKRLLEKNSLNDQLKN
jgi:hypothetical protein